MHTYKLPREVLDDWLENYPSTTENYGHLLLEQTGACDAAFLGQLRSYFESAHFDAREHFHEEINLDLHPDFTSPGSHAIYPNCLPSRTLRGLFGEVMAGMLTEQYDFVGGHKWQVPIFLFRHHEDVKHYLFALVRDASLTREVLGRHGSDFLAVALDSEGKVERYLSGEAKWRKTLSKSVVSTLLLGGYENDVNGKRVRSNKGIWGQLNERDTNIPLGMRQLQKLLKARAPEKFAAAIFSIDQALMLVNSTPIARTNLILICGNDFPARGVSHSLIGWKEKPQEYTSPHDLQVVELILADGDNLIDAIYQSLWSGT